MDLLRLFQGLPQAWQDKLKSLAMHRVPSLMKSQGFNETTIGWVMENLPNAVRIAETYKGSKDSAGAVRDVIQKLKMDRDQIRSMLKLADNPKLLTILDGVAPGSNDLVRQIKNSFEKNDGASSTKKRAADFPPLR